MARFAWTQDPADAHAAFEQEAVGVTLPHTMERRIDDETRFDSSRRPAPVIDGDLTDAANIKRILTVLAGQGIVNDLTSMGSGRTRATGTDAPGLTALAAAGTTAVATVNDGIDDRLVVQLVPSGAGIAAGSILTVTFATPVVGFTDNPYMVMVTPASNNARSLGGVVGPTNHNAGSFDLDTRTALTSGNTYIWNLLVVPLYRGVD